MKLAVIDQVGNFGGSSRVVRALVPALARLRPNDKIVFFGNALAIERERLDNEFLQYSISAIPLASTLINKYSLIRKLRLSKVIEILRQRFGNIIERLPYYISGSIHYELKILLKEFDMALFTWPYQMKYPEISCPSVGIFHDFNFKYFFSSFPAYTEKQYSLIDYEMPRWLNNTTPVVTSRFMADEVRRFYPQIIDKVRLIRLAPMSNISVVRKKKKSRVISELGLRKPFILYPTNLHSHKNIGVLLTAMSILKKKKIHCQLVLTGPETEVVNGFSCEIGLIRKNDPSRDVFGLGYVSNAVMDALIESAAVVVSASLYEAGNGPGIDAWTKGVPVAMSNIPPFIEHLDEMGVKAEVFNPHDPEDIAEKIAYILRDPEKAAKNAKISQDAINKRTWEDVASEFYEIFDKITENRK